MNGNSYEDSDVIEVVPGWGVRLAQASTIEIRAAIYFKETNWQYSENDGPIVSYSIDSLWDACEGHFPSVAAMKNALATKGGNVFEPVVKVERGYFIELSKATANDLRIALDHIANPVPSERLGPLWRFMRMAFADHVVDEATIRTASAKRNMN
jgi:hypothetical protein